MAKGRRRLHLARPAWILLAVAAAAPAPACSSDYKKLSSGGSIADTLMYDVLGNDRDPSYYYTLVQRSHCPQTFCYLCGDDPYILDKNVDAIQRLGDASFGRLEGQAETLVLLEEILIEDRSALARAAAATSMTKIALKLPRYPASPVPDDGRQFLALAQEIGRIYGGGCPLAPPARARVAAALQQIGNLDFDDLKNSKNAVKELVGRAYLVDERDPQVRTAYDTAVVKRSHDLVLTSLRLAMEDPAAEVRVDAVRGLKTLGDAESQPAVLDRLARESAWLVRLEIVEYLGRTGGGPAVAGLLPLLDDADASVRHKSREALTRIAGRDLGIRRRSWEAWARQAFPGLSLPEAAEGEARPVPVPR